MHNSNDWSATQSAKKFNAFFLLEKNTFSQDGQLLRKYIFFQTTQKKKPLLSSSCWNDLEEFRVDTGWWLASIGYITQGMGPWFYFVYFGGKFQVAVGRSKQNIFASIKRVCSSGNPLWLLLRDTKAGGKNPGWHHSSALSGRADLYIRGDPVT